MCGIDLLKVKIIVLTLSQINMPNLRDFEFDVVTVDARGQETNRQRHSAQYLAEDLGNGIVLSMVSIPGGTFLMSSPDTEKDREDGDEPPQHEVIVAPFFMGKTPVTQAQWQAVAALPQINQSLDRDPSYYKGTTRPVDTVTWCDAVEFCARLSEKTERNYRLPSEAEWEYACRGGTTSPFHFGETITPNLANYNGNDVYGSEPVGEYRQETTVVGSFQVANPFGLYDMHGNVWEWCADHWYNKDDKGDWEYDRDDMSRLLRGGCWSNSPRYCRSACRHRDQEDFGYELYGFRVAVQF